MGNMLENTVECTCEEFVAEIAGKRRKPYLDALKSTFKTIVLGKSTLVKEMSSFLRENEGRLERKRVQELMSGWLNAYDFAALLNPYLLARSAADVTDEATLAVDFSDISKEFGGDGMEGMEMGCDGSRRCTATGHDFISVSLVGAAYREAFPVYAKLGMGRHCHADLIYGAIRAVMEGTGGLGWLVFDRGMDDARFLRTTKRDGRKAAVRVKDEGRDVFGDGRTVGGALADVPFAKARLKTCRGDRLAEVRCRVGTSGTARILAARTRWRRTSASSWSSRGSAASPSASTSSARTRSSRTAGRCSPGRSEPRRPTATAGRSRPRS